MAPFQALRSFILGAVAVLAMTAHAYAVGQASLDFKNDPGLAIRRVIEQQLDAIRKDDAERALSFATPTIRTAFRDAATFMALLAKEYAPIIRWDKATFLDLRNKEDHYVQRVKLIDKKGKVAVANYALVKANTGEWFVAGVAIEDSDTAKVKTE
ncbi:MAG: DUF4864 domain-containing protein [Rhodospirillaceae bacterium]|nr:DUF4864 domain-containing protein [Rhodospirillaceae bacterium]